MPSIDLVGVSYAHLDSVPLLRDLDLRLRPGWLGVVGPNGSGKTTFLRLLEGDLSPDAGRIARSPARLRAHLCAQAIEERPADVEDFAEAQDGLSAGLRGRLVLAPVDLERWPTLSPGERKRWQVGAALAREPELLLLDEPTNHLDADARARLIDALREHRGIGVVVSHDRSLLDTLTSSTLRFHAGAVDLYRGAYSIAREDWESRDRERRRARRQLQTEGRRERQRAAESRRRHDHASARMRTSKRIKGRKDSAGRAAFKAKRRRTAEVAAARDLRNASQRVERIAEQLSQTRFEKHLGRSLFVDWRPAPVPHLLTVELETLERGGRVLARDLRLSIARESRVHLAGPNGAGKTTLLEALVAGARVPRDRLLLLPQELAARETRTLLDEARSLDPETRGRLMNGVAALGVDPEALLSSEQPSPGEARKLALAMGLARQVWALVLDEPTNHLDLPSIERLEEALTAYPGALLVVSHDDAFGGRVANQRWELRDGRLQGA
jgi:ATPase subunit of ABC transporter with duplicated ATPase domains